MTTSIEKLIETTEKELSIYTNDSGSGSWESVKVSLWEKEDKKRIYLNLSYGRRGKWTRGVSYYVCLNTLKVVDSSRKYNNAYENQTVKDAADNLAEALSQLGE